MKKIENQVEYMPVKDLTVYIDNPRTIKKDDFERLVQSIKDNPDYFEARPLIVSDETATKVFMVENPDNYSWEYIKKYVAGGYHLCI